MKVLFRTDASETTGTGHLMRCLALGSALKKDGAAVTFACARLPGSMEQLVLERRFELVKVETPSSGEEMDADATLAALKGQTFDWAVVDHYGLAAAWELRARKACSWMLAIDDLANRAHACDVLLDQNLRRGKGAGYDQLLPAGCERLLGPRYALLDAAFEEERSRLDENERQGVLISFGGSDPHALTLPVLRALLDHSASSLRIDVVAGGLNRDVRAIQDSAAGAPNVSFHQATRDMARLMARAQVYVGAGGSTSWERCCLALPGVVVAVAGNQEAACLALDDAGSHIYLGKASSVSPEAIAQATLALLASPFWRSRLGSRSSAIVDGSGATRVAARLSAGQVRLRQATKADSEAILQWRNHPDIRRYSGSAGEIAQSAHEAWLARVLSNPARHLLVAEDDRGALGVLRYDVVGSAAEVSIYVVPERLGSGVGTKLLAAGERWLASRRPEVHALSANVRGANRASCRLFSDAGYQLGNSVYSKALSGRETK